MKALLIVLAAVAAAAAGSVALVVSGCLPRLAGRAVYVVDSLLEAKSEPSTLSRRERAELVARLWVPL